MKVGIEINLRTAIMFIFLIIIIIGGLVIKIFSSNIFLDVRYYRKKENLNKPVETIFIDQKFKNYCERCHRSDTFLIGNRCADGCELLETPANAKETPILLTYLKGNEQVKTVKGKKINRDPFKFKLP